MILRTDAGPVAEEFIQVAAYYHYENRLSFGSEGNELGDWLRAETDILGGDEGEEQTEDAVAAAAGAIVDDLTALKGVGKVLADRLGKAGYQSLEKVAALTDAEIGELDASLKLRGRIKRDGWVEQARALLGR